jgi:hypothetical protein
VLHAFRKAALLENAATFVNVRRDRARIRLTKGVEPFAILLPIDFSELSSRRTASTLKMQK